MNLLETIDKMLADGACHSVFIGKSAMPGRKCFATLVSGSAVTISTGSGNTSAEALADALHKLPSYAPAPAVTRPAMPGFTRNVMPGFGG
jgi:hypothetical protein